MSGFMLDTSAVNRIHDSGQCEWSLRGSLFVTEIQLQEIAHTPDRHRRNSLLSAFVSLRMTVIRPLGMSFMPEYFGFSGYFDGCFLLPQDDYPRLIGSAMPQIAAFMGGKIEKKYPDALIAEFARTSGLTLVTADRKQAKAGRMFGVHVEQIN